uniref:Uncharacterized protein n=1 Tax=Plectus sambesii TaxID=2011161 RepID=A0A914UVZ3_9BILA
MRRALLVLLSVVIVGVLGVSEMKQSSKKLFPPGMHPSLFPEAVFDPSAPSCMPEREPCGFYSFSLHGSQQLKWIKSWCQCDEDHACSYDRTDMKMRVYRHVCVSKSLMEEAVTEARLK